MVSDRKLERVTGVGMPAVRVVQGGDHARNHQSAEAVALRHEIEKVAFDVKHHLSIDFAAGVTEHNAKSITVWFEGEIEVARARLRPNYLERAVQRAISRVSDESSIDGFADRVLLEFRTTTSLTKEELSAVARLLGRTEREMGEAIKRVQDLRDKGLPLSLPDTVPEANTYAKRPKGETVIDFLRRVWKPYIQAQLMTRAYLRKINPEAETAVDSWLYKHKTPLPADIHLPTVKELNDRAVSDPTRVRDAMRLSSARSRRSTGISPS